MWGFRWERNASPRKLPEWLTEPEVNKLIDSVDNLRDKTILELMYATGCRPKELRSIQISKIDFTTREIRVMGKDEDGAYRKERFILFTKRALTLVKRYLKERRPQPSFEDILFLNGNGEGLSPDELNKMVKGHIKTILLRDIKHPNPAYILRHSFATNLMNRDVGEQYLSPLMGHKDFVATQFYTHLAIKRLCEQHKKFFQFSQAVRPL